MTRGKTRSAWAKMPHSRYLQKLAPQRHSGWGSAAQFLQIDLARLQRGVREVAHQAPSPRWHCPIPVAARPAQPHSHSHSHPRASGQTLSKPKLYNPRHPERTLLYPTIAEHFGTWFELASAGQFDGQGDQHTPKPYVRQAFRKYLECGIFAHGFARARCGDCGHDYFVAFSCKGRGVCPSCNTRRIAQTAAHLTDHVFPRLPVRQWVLCVPKRLRYFLQRDGAVLSMVLRIFLRVIAQSLQAHSPGAANVDKVALHIGAVAFIHRFGSSLNEHVHFHVCVVAGVFEEVTGGTDADAEADAEADADADADLQSSPTSVIFGAPRTGLGAPGLAPLGNAVPIQPEPAEPVPPKRSPAHYLWAVLITRIYEVFPLLCPICGGQMRPIAFITHSADIRQILDHIGVGTEPPRRHRHRTLMSISASIGDRSKRRF